MDDEITALVRPLVEPGPTEVRRAKRMILDALSNGVTHDTDELIGLLPEAENATRPSEASSMVMPLAASQRRPDVGVVVLGALRPSGGRSAGPRASTWPCGARTDRWSIWACPSPRPEGGHLRAYVVGK